MGLPSSVYWFTNWLFDATAMLILAVFGIIVYRATIYDAAKGVSAFESFSVWIIITCLAAPLHGYMVSRYCVSHSKAQVMYHCQVVYDMYDIDVDGLLSCASSCSRPLASCWPCAMYF